MTARPGNTWCLEGVELQVHWRGLEGNKPHSFTPVVWVHSHKGDFSFILFNLHSVGRLSHVSANTDRRFPWYPLAQLNNPIKCFSVKFQGRRWSWNDLLMSYKGGSQIHLHDHLHEVTKESSLFPSHGVFSSIWLINADIWFHRRVKQKNSRRDVLISQQIAWSFKKSCDRHVPVSHCLLRTDVEWLHLDGCCKSTNTFYHIVQQIDR